MKHPHAQDKFAPRILAWELTRRCNLTCIPCRAAASQSSPEGELSLSEYKALLDNVASFSKPIIILTGGEPLLRPDLYEIAAYGTSLGLTMAVSTNGTLLTDAVAKKLYAAGVRRCSISLDGSNAQVHDDFRRQPGAFAASIQGIKILQANGIGVQVNTSLTQRNRFDLDHIFKLVKSLGVAAWHLFMLVPTGRGSELADRELITTEGYEAILNYLYEKNRDEDFEIKPTCAPQYYRILRQRAQAEGIEVTPEKFGINARTRGCLAGMGFGFVSYQGDVFPCGYYPIKAGNVREQSFRDIWENSPLFLKLRNFKLYQGSCGHCRFIGVCGGCRARALAVTGNDLAQEPYCAYTEQMIHQELC